MISEQVQFFLFIANFACANEKRVCNLQDNTRFKAQRQHAALHAANGLHVSTMCMHYAVGIRPGRVDCAVNDEPSLKNAQVCAAGVKNPSLSIDL
jgi:hypothetical protein